MSRLLDQVWRQLTGRTGTTGEPAELIAIHGPARVLPGPLASTELAVAAVGSALLAAADLAEARGRRRPTVDLDTRHVADAVRSERFTRIEGRPPADLFDPLSAFFPVADGWVRLHANYPHHRSALLAVLGLPAGSPADVDEVRRRLAGWRGTDLEEALAANGSGAALRTWEEWSAHPAGTALADLGLLDLEVDVAPATDGPGRPALGAGPDRLPAHGVRVLDLTRVIAGPVATRTLAALGADVLRVDPPDLPEIELGHVDTGLGKRTALLDLRTPDGRARVEQLLDEADVLVHGYRPGALERLGLDHAGLRARHPQLVVVGLSAWGHRGPWAGRRGFDSIVQSATGIAAATGSDGGPGTLPAQVLDHATGHLAAAAALRGLAERERTGRASRAWLALARTAGFLLAAGPADETTEPTTVTPGAPPSGGSAYQVRLDSGYGPITVVAPPGRLDGVGLRWPHGSHRWGTDQARWADRDR